MRAMSKAIGITIFVIVAAFACAPASKPSADMIGDELVWNLEWMEGDLWRAAQQYHTHAPFTVTAQHVANTQADAEDLIQAYMTFGADSVEPAYYGRDTTSLEIFGHSLGHNGEIKVTPLIGWHVRAWSPLLRTRRHFHEWFGIMKAIDKDDRWHLESTTLCGITRAWSCNRASSPSQPDM